MVVLLLFLGTAGLEPLVARTGSAAVPATGAPEGSRPEPADPPPDSLALRIHQLEGALRRESTSGSIRLDLAEAYRQRGNLVAARAIAEEAERRGLSSEDSVRAVWILADVAMRQGRENEARRRMTRLASRGTASPEVLARLAQMRWDDRQPDEAMALAMTAAGLAPAGPEIVHWTAARWKEEGRIDLALGLFRHRARARDADEEDLFQFAFLQHLLGDEAGATEGYLRLLQRGPMHPQGNYNLSILRLAAADTSGAIDCLERTIRARDAVPQAYLDLAMLYMSGKNLPEARRVLLLYRTDASPDSASDAEVQEILREISR